MSKIRFVAVGVILVVLIVLIGSAPLAQAPLGESINYEGTLTDPEGTPLSQTVTMEFRLYDSESGGNLLWGPETHVVQVREGTFQVQLGSITPIDLANVAGVAYLEVVVDGETLSPRELFETTSCTAGMSPDANCTCDDLTVNLTANLTDGELRNVRALQLKDWDDDTGGTDNKYRVLARDGAVQFFNGGVAIGGYNNGTWTDLADGTLIVKGNVGIGTIAPSAQLYIYRNSTGANGITVENGLTTNAEHPAEITFKRTAISSSQQAAVGVDYTARDFFIWVNGQDRLNIDTNGNVGIGTRTPSRKLHVTGTAQVDGFFYLGGTDLVMNEVAGRGGGRALVNDANDTLTINYDHDFGGGVKINGPVSCGALVETNLQTGEELDAGQIDRFEEGDVLCWGVDRLELCAAANDRLVQAVADAHGRPIVLGAEVIKVIGPVKRGDILVASDIPGYAMVNNNPVPGSVIAQALEDLTGQHGLIKAMIRKW